MKHCLICDTPMKEGCLPGYWVCPECGLFLDTQCMASPRSITAYKLNFFSSTFHTAYHTITIPEGTLLILKELPL